MGFQEKVVGFILFKKFFSLFFSFHAWKYQARAVNKQKVGRAWWWWLMSRVAGVCDAVNLVPMGRADVITTCSSNVITLFFPLNMACFVLQWLMDSMIWEHLVKNWNSAGAYFCKCCPILAVSFGLYFCCPPFWTVLMID